MINVTDDVNFEELFSVKSSFDLIKSFGKLPFNTVLDVGCGQGGAALYLASIGKKVTSLDFDFKRLTPQAQKLVKKYEIELINSSFEEISTDKKYDAIIMNHVLEHLPNPGFILSKVKDLLSENGWLYISVPPYKSLITSSHITTGWNLGQLMLNLLNENFDIKNGHFKTYFYNVCAFVQKRTEPLPENFLNARKGLIKIDETSNLWPMPVTHHFDGNINEINWFKDFETNYDANQTKLGREFYLSLYESVKDKFNKIMESNNNKRIFLYGAGLFSEILTERIDLSKTCGILDKEPAKYYSKINGITVYPPEIIRKIKPDVIVSTIYNNKEKVCNSIDNFIKQEKINCELIIIF